MLGKDLSEELMEEVVAEFEKQWNVINREEEKRMDVFYASLKVENRPVNTAMADALRGFQKLTAPFFCDIIIPSFREIEEIEDDSVTSSNQPL